MTNDSSTSAWVRSSYSSGGGAECVEWAPGAVSECGAVPVRDSKTPERPELHVSPDAWRAFVEHVRR